MSRLRGARRCRVAIALCLWGTWVFVLRGLLAFHTPYLQPRSRAQCRRTVCDGAVVCRLEVAVCGEGVADTRVLGLNQLFVDRVVEALGLLISAGLPSC
jgi:hypothetical protein